MQRRNRLQAGSYTFPPLNRRLGAAGTFWIHAAIGLGRLTYILRSRPETKQKSLEKIEEELLGS
jgi:SP family sugar porter-like MFS transporter